MEGRRIECEPRDRYGRTVSVCRADGRDLGAEMVRAGMALASVRYNSDHVKEELSVVCYDTYNNCSARMRLGSIARIGCTSAMRSHEPVRWDIHCDESSQTDHRYIVIGAMYGRADRTAQVIKAIEKAIGPPFPGTSELKWTKIRSHNVPMYKSLISALHPLMKAGTVRFHCLVIDSNKSDHKRYNEGDKELGFTKYAFTLLFKFARLHAKGLPPEFYVHLDNRGTRYSPEVTRITLNYRDASQHGRTYEAYKVVHFVESKDNRMVQAADVFTGAVAAAWNQNHSAAHKREMIDFIEKKWFLPSLAQQTMKQIALRGIDIWFLDWDARS